MEVCVRTGFSVRPGRRASRTVLLPLCSVRAPGAALSRAVGDVLAPALAPAAGALGPLLPVPALARGRAEGQGRSPAPRPRGVLGSVGALVGVPVGGQAPAAPAVRGRTWQWCAASDDDGGTLWIVVLALTVPDGVEASDILDAAASVLHATAATPDPDPSDARRRVLLAFRQALRPLRVAVADAVLRSVPLATALGGRVTRSGELSTRDGTRAKLSVQVEAVGRPAGPVVVVSDEHRAVLVAATRDGRLAELERSPGALRWRGRGRVGSGVRAMPAAWLAADGLHLSWTDAEDRLWHRGPRAAPRILAEDAPGVPSGRAEGSTSVLELRGADGALRRFTGRAGRALAEARREEPTPRLVIPSPGLLRGLSSLRVASGHDLAVRDPVAATGAPAALRPPVAVAGESDGRLVAWAGVDGHVHLAEGPGDRWNHRDLSRDARAPAPAGPLSLHRLPGGVLLLHYVAASGTLVELRRDADDDWSLAPVSLLGDAAAL